MTESAEKMAKMKIREDGTPDLSDDFTREHIVNGNPFAKRVWPALEKVQDPELRAELTRYIRAMTGSINARGAATARLINTINGISKSLRDINTAFTKVEGISDDDRNAIGGMIFAAWMGAAVVGGMAGVAASAEQKELAKEFGLSIAEFEKANSPTEADVKAHEGHDCSDCDKASDCPIKPLKEAMANKAAGLKGAADVIGRMVQPTKNEPETIH
jgi:hypothetical protein